VRAVKATTTPLGGTVTLAIRPEAIRLCEPGRGVPVEVVDRSYLGDHHRYRVRIGAALVTVQTSHRPVDESWLSIEIPPGCARAYPSGAP
jgi:iron(III) transport system ATP-binding protein